MVRVVNRKGLLLLISPSQGNFHRYPVDAFRFYPDSGTALEKWAQDSHFPIKLIESFTTQPKNDVWADHVAIFSYSPNIYGNQKIGGVSEGENWIVDGNLRPETYQEKPFELRKIEELEKLIAENLVKYYHVNQQFELMKVSLSWQITKPLRLFKGWFKNLPFGSYFL